MRTALVLLAIATAANAAIPVAAPALRTASGIQQAPALATNGRDAFLAWQDGRATTGGGSEAPGTPQWDVYATPLAADGQPVAGDGGVPVEPSFDDEVAPAVVWNGAEYVVAQLNTRLGVVVTRMSTHESHLINVANVDPHGALSMAWNGKVYLLTISGNRTIRGVLLDRELNVIKGPFAISDTARNNTDANVASDGDSFLAVWVERPRDASDGQIDSIYVANVTAAGGVTEQVPLEAYNTPAWPVTAKPGLTWLGQRYIVTWSDTKTRAMFVDRDGKGRGAMITVFGGGFTPTVAATSNTILIAFVVPGLGLDLYYVRLTLLGDVLDAVPVAIATGVFDQTQPALVAVGGNFVIAWQDAGDIKCGPINASFNQGTPQSLPALSLGFQHEARGLFDGVNFVFAWSEEGHVLVNRVTRGGFPLDGGGVDTLTIHDDPQLAANADIVLVEGTWGGPADPNAISLRRMARADGRFLDPFGQILPFQHTGAMAGDGVDFLVIGGDTAPNGAKRLRPIRVMTAPGSVVAQPPVQDAFFDQTAPALAWNGTHYVLVFTQSLGLQGSIVRAVLLDANGVVVSPVVTLPNAPVPCKLAAHDGVALLAGNAGQSVVALRIDTSSFLTRDRTIATCPDCAVSDVVWNGSDFTVAYGRRARRVGLDGEPIGPDAIIAPNDAGPATLITTPFGLVSLFNQPIEVLPSIHTGAIRRAFFSYLPLDRRRPSQ